MRISDWSSDVCSSDLGRGRRARGAQPARDRAHHPVSRSRGGQVTTPRRGTDMEDSEFWTARNALKHIYENSTANFASPWHILALAIEGALPQEIGRASCRERVCQYV